MCESEHLYGFANPCCYHLSITGTLVGMPWQGGLKIQSKSKLFITVFFCLLFFPTLSCFVFMHRLIFLIFHLSKPCKISQTQSYYWSFCNIYLSLFFKKKFITWFYFLIFYNFLLILCAFHIMHLDPFHFRIPSYPLSVLANPVPK